MDDLLREFLVDTAEALAVLESDLTRLEAEPGNQNLISSAFRKLHTIKGTCGFLGLSRLGRLAHAGENVLGGLRTGALKPSPGVIGAILRCVDAIKDLIATIEASGAEGAADHTDLLAGLDRLHEGGDAALPTPPLAESLAAEPVTEVPEHAGGALAPPTTPPSGLGDEAARELSAAGQTVRIGIGLLEGLMSSVSELVLARNQLLQLLRNDQDSAFAAPLRRLSAITTELQDSILKARLQPVGNAWTALPRLVRDLSKDLGKAIVLSMEGAETELDRQVLELIKDPLTHMVRNAADHGLETPAARRAAGKEETGNIRLNAYQQGGHIVIDVSDDGHGLDAACIRRKAIQNGLVGAVEADRMTDADTFRFIMRPGFSTASAVTAVSGRGVGMDVVRANIEKIGGTIDIASRPGHGASFTIRIPLTLAIVSALIIGCAGERFAVPQVAVAELVRAASSGERRIERINGAAMLRLRNRLLPLISLRGVLALDTLDAAEDDVLIVVTQTGPFRFGIIVDQIHDTEDIVVKPLPPLLGKIGAYSGNTILGDGAVCMILDPAGLAASLGQGQQNLPAGAEPEMMPAQPQHDSSAMRLLVVRAGSAMRKLVPLDLLTRIEEIELGSIQRADGRMFVQQGERLMPVIPAAETWAQRVDGRQPLLVFTAPPAGAGAQQNSQKLVGVLVDEIVDIIESTVVLQASGRRPDLIGTAIVGGAPAEVLNVAHFLAIGGEACRPSPQAADHHGRACVLVADPNAFFRSLIATTLQVEGFQVRTAAGAEDALAIVRQGAAIALVLASTDMPGLCAYDLARRFGETAPPMIGLSSLVTEEDQRRSRAAGFLRHQQKLDQKRLAETVKELLGSGIETRQELVA